MRYGWLEELVEEGLVRKEAAEAIYQDCSSVMEKSASVDPKALLNMLMIGTGMSALTAGIAAAAQSIQRRILDAKTKTQIDMNRQRIVSSFSPSDREKAEARFNEIAKFAPNLAANEEVMRRYLPMKVRNGMTDQDVQRLIVAQMQITPDPFRYSAISKTASLATPEWISILSANAMADACIEAHKTLDGDLFCKTAGHILRVMDGAAAVEMEKVAAPQRIPGGFTDMMKNILVRMSVPMAISGGLSAGYIGSKMLEDRRMASKLDQTYNKIMQMSPDSILTNNPEKARQAFQTLAHFAPNVATEPYAAKAYMTKLVSYDQGPTAADIKDLSEIQKNLGSVRGGMLDMLSKSMESANQSLVRGVEKTWDETTSPYQKALNEDITARIEQGI